MNRFTRTFTDVKNRKIVLFSTFFYSVYSIAFPSIFPTGTTIFDPEKS